MSSIHQITERLQDYFNDDKYEDAIIFLEQLKSEESSPDTLNLINHHLGRIYFFREEYDSAKLFFYEAIRHMPLDFYSKIFLSKILELENKIFAAMKVLGLAFNEVETQQQVLYTIKSKLKYVIDDDDKEIDTILKNNIILTSEIKVSSYPKISIIILCYNKVDFTEKCLRALFKNTHYKNYEVIVVDNASVDETPGLLESYGDRIKFIHSNKNLGFVGGNNYAAEYASGYFLVFLNNDTEVLPNWLENLHSIFKYYPDAGAAGSMLIYPNGKLQEAGGAIFNNATGWNYGKNANPIDSKYSFVREVDYCSGAALMVRKDLFTRLGGFDVRYTPAYYEDTDLCFGIRKLGYKVYYSPFSKVIHYEGATSGTDLTSGFKKYQGIKTSVP
jgi:GT2 family glycosyltransferase